MRPVTVSVKGQVVLPIEVRRRLRIEPGAKLSVELSGDGRAVTLRLARGESASVLAKGFGMLKARRHARVEDLSGAEAARRLAPRARQ
jgi:AbrB family looped-hinge helix DNA binding protein